MNPLSSLEKYALIALSLILLVSGFGFWCYKNGENHIQTKWDAATKQAAVDLAKQIAEDEQKIQRGVDASSKAATRYEENINAIRSHYNNVHVVDSSGLCKQSGDYQPPVSQVSDTSNRVNEPPSNSGTVTEQVITTDFSTLPKRCAETTQQLLDLQVWIKEEMGVFNVD